MNIANKIVANAIKAQTARNSVEVEVSLMYAGRVQHAMRDAVRTVSGVRMTSTNTLICPDEDAADEVVDILEQAGVPKREISLNAECVARRTSTNAVTITRDNRKEDYWIHGTVGDFKFEAKMFDEGSVYGIDHGRVSKLWMVRALPNNGREIVSYERGWDVRPKSPEAKAAFSELMGKLKNLPKVDNAVARNERVARNADYTDATNKLRFCLDSLYKADDYRNEAVRTVAQLINEGVIDKSAASKMNELQKLFEQAMAIGKDLYYNKLRP